MADSPTTNQPPGGAPNLVEEGHDSVPTTSPETFHLFGDLPLELRQRIWDAAILPRTVIFGSSERGDLTRKNIRTIISVLKSVNREARDSVIRALEIPCSRLMRKSGYRNLETHAPIAFDPVNDTAVLDYNLAMDAQRFRIDPAFAVIQEAREVMLIYNELPADWGPPAMNCFWPLLFLIAAQYRMRDELRRPSMGHFSKLEKLTIVLGPRSSLATLTRVSLARTMTEGSDEGLPALWVCRLEKYGLRTRRQRHNSTWAFWSVATLEGAVDALHGVSVWLALPAPVMGGIRKVRRMT